MRRALVDVRSKKLSIRGAAKRYKVPYTCLTRRIEENITGPNTVLTDKEEKEIVDWLLYVSARGFPVTASELKDSVKTMLDLQQRQTIFKENLPGRSWFRSFLRRNETLSVRLAENLSKSRASVTKELIETWFDEVTIYN